ncbi:hypothetical protein TanjilG_12152 [Lupinus angustifolius]|uniref:Integrator complex subunit 4/Protein SIEL C-terminal Ig-like domain-containing protein n=2 Tax=Lupinus angustifolius TaxID=3871 RepID=A0A1J7GDS5_LUPAN|nr:hypothetical protein TanjilG_12152 [Lupinus angustifolius]
MHTLSVMRSQIINPSTPKSNLISILQALTHALQSTNQTRNQTHHILKLLSDLAAHHSSLSQLVLDSLRSNSPDPSSITHLAFEGTVESLHAITSILDDGLVSLDDSLFVSLCFGPNVSARIWMLRNAGLRFQVRPALLLGVCLGLTKDPYPYVREASLEGIHSLCECGVFEDVSLVEACYGRGVELLSDMHDCVRLSAVRVVASWGVMLAASNADMKNYLSNEVFAKLCSMARDMSMKVRAEAFNGIGKIEIVSEDFLLQSLSKRVLTFGKTKKTLYQSTSEQFVKLATSVAGALVHGLEDEFFEVRKSACQSLYTLTILSLEFAHEAINFLMDMLNDDSVVVQLQALETLHHMAINGFLKLQEIHLHMFLGVLVDNNREVRYAERKILKVVKLNDRVLFKSSIDSLLENLVHYPQDEDDVLSAFSHLGRNHKKYVGLIIKEIFEEVEAAFEGNFEFNSVRIAALLTLSISSPLLNGHIGSIPPVMFSYAVTFLGRIYCAFSDIMDRNALLAYLCEKSRSTGHSGGDAPNLATKEEIESQITRDPKEVANYKEEQQLANNEVIDFTNYILAKLPDMWAMIQSGFTNKVLGSLRCWKEELTTMMASDSSGYGDALAFTLQNLRIFKLLAEVWQHLLPEKTDSSQRMGVLESKLGKLDKRVKELMCRFLGFSAEEEITVLELILVTFSLRLCKVKICSANQTFKKLNAIYLQVESLLKESSTLPSNFIVELGKLLHESSTAINEASSRNPLPFDECLKLFSFKKFTSHGTIKHLKAELSIPNNDLEHPFPFVSRLPAGIPCNITAHNVSTEKRLWLRISMDDGFVHHVFLDLDLFEGSGKVKKFAFVAPFYRTAKAGSVTLKVSIGLESLFENACPVQRHGGPKRELVLLCAEKQVYLSNVNKE